MKNIFMLGLYTINNNSFVAFFCENKNTPEKLCGGKCAINKLFQEPTSDSTFSKVDLNTKKTDYFSNQKLVLASLNYQPKHTNHKPYINNYKIIFFDDDKKPPRS